MMDIGILDLKKNVSTSIRFLPTYAFLINPKFVLKYDLTSLDPFSISLSISLSLVIISKKMTKMEF